MVQHKPTPEEQLLKLIENPDAAAKGAAGGGKAAAGAVSKKKGLNPSILSGLFSPLTKLFKKPGPVEVDSLKIRRPAVHLNIKTANQILLALVIAAVIYLALDLTLLKEDKQKYLSTVSTNDMIYSISGHGGVQKQDLSHYQEVIDRRNPFLPAGASAPAQEGQDEAPIPRPNTNKMTEVLNALKLVGLTWSADEPLAMIEEASTGRTYFLKRGQEVNGLKIQSISKEKVTVTYEGEEGALY